MDLPEHRGAHTGISSKEAACSYASHMMGMLCDAFV
jgi:hypothetical protein